MYEKLVASLRLYAARVKVIAQEEEDDDVIATLAERDGIQDDLDAGARLTVEQEAFLRQADDLLVSQARTLVDRHPDVFTPDRQNAGPRSYWWWFLNEGPQVREKAREAA